MECKVLIVDDDPMMLFLHKSLIKKSGISSEPHTFLNGEEVLNYLLQEVPGNTSYIILLDINMPVMNGWEFLDNIAGTAISTHIDVAVVSSSIDKKDREKAFKYPQVLTYLSKPFFDLDEIRRIQERRLQ